MTGRAQPDEPEAAGPPGPALDDPGRPYGGQLPDARRADRRRKLLDAALECYGTIGYRATSVAQLCRVAKVAPAKFYEEFSSQESLLIELCELIAAEQRHAVMAAIEVEPRLVDRAGAGVSAYCRTLLADQRRAQVLCVEAAGVSAAAEGTRRLIIADFAELLVDQYRQFGLELSGGPHDDGRVRMVATALIGGVHEAVLQWLHDPRGVDIDELVEALTGVIIATGNWLLAGRFSTESD